MTFRTSPFRVPIPARVVVTIGSLALLACFGKTTTSLGSVGDGSSDPSGDGRGTPAELVTKPDASTADLGDAASSGLACQIGDPPLPTASCPTGEYCKADPGAAACSSGHCTKKPPPPPSCPSLECGCDGVVRCTDYSRSQGIDVGPGRCGLPCGPDECDGLTEYCSHGAGGAMTLDGGANTIYQCRKYPKACENDHSCACMHNAGIAGMCTAKDGKVDLDEPLP